MRAYVREDGGIVNLFPGGVDYGFFELYGLKPLAGGVFSRAQRGDATPADSSAAVKEAVLNETALRAAGFASAAQAIGTMLETQYGGERYRIIGVVPDFSVDVLHEPVRATLYHVDPRQHEWLSIKLSGRHIPQTLAAIDRLWERTGDPKPIQRKFFDRHLRQQASDVANQAWILGVFSGVAVFIACLGLFGLSAFTAERRTKEIGIRKALGGRRADILQLLIWEFIRPVLWANLLAWPAGYLAMNHWLRGFASHVDLEISIFIGASACSLAIALLTVSAHAYAVAGNKPVAALRYE